MNLSIVGKCIATGLVAGVASGLFGVGGGIVIVPILIFWFGLSAQSANGTSLVALLLPVSSFAVWNYYRAGKISVDNIYVGLTIGAALAIGAVGGSQLALSLDQDLLKKIFSIFLVVVAAKLWFSA